MEHLICRTIHRFGDATGRDRHLEFGDEQVAYPLVERIEFHLNTPALILASSIQYSFDVDSRLSMECDVGIVPVEK